MHTEVVIHLMNAYCGVGAKSVAHLMKFYLLQWEVMKVKFLINSNMTLTGQGHYDKVKGQIKVTP